MGLTARGLPRSRTELSRVVDTGGIALGAFANGRVAGIGSCRSEQFEQIARTACDSDMVVAATPPENTVRFYLGRGFQPMAKPLAALFELEPDDVHMHKVL